MNYSIYHIVKEFPPKNVPGLYKTPGGLWVIDIDYSYNICNV